MVTKPVVNGSTETWGTILNSALDDLQAGVDASVKSAVATTKGDLLAATAAATVGRQPVGTNGNVLTADSAQNTGLRWGLAPGTLVFRARQTTAQTIATGGSPKVVAFNLVDLDRLSGWDASTNTFTPGVPGWYECTGLLTYAAFSPATGSRNLYWGPGAGATLSAAAIFHLGTASLMTCPARAFTMLIDGSSVSSVQMLTVQNTGGNLDTASNTSAGWQGLMQVKYVGPA